ncbi:MAG: cell division protein ZapD [gamma proteobacterium symbiont of Bathyaustriella thionipta]|nr:cell division protein ZapD [gamma proteobacterium symbiont of Bathyaustriella thionipta]
MDTSSDTDLHFEYPLNERTRLFLRLDYLAGDFDQLLQHADAAGYRAAMQRASDIVALASRGDLKAELLKEMKRIHAFLLKYQKMQAIDVDKLEGLLQDVSNFSTQLSQSGKSFLASVRANEFVTSLFNRFNMPGGSYSFDMPEFHYYLEMTNERNQLFLWIESEIKQLHKPVRFILKLLRESLHSQQQVSNGHCFSTEFERNQVPNLLRVSLSKGELRYPEIIAGGNRVNIRFVSKAGATMKDNYEEVSFKLAQSIY